MSNPNYFTAISYGSQATTWSMGWFLESVDDYFYLGGQKACVLKGQDNGENRAVILRAEKASYTVLKVISYFTGIIPIIMFVFKTGLRLTHHFHLIDPRQELENGLVIDDRIKVKIETVYDHILKKENDGEGEIQYINDMHHLCVVFKLKSVPGFIFKKMKVPESRYYSGSLEGFEAMQPNAKTEKRFNRMVRLKAECIFQGFQHLRIPRTTMFIVKGRDLLIAQECIDIVPNVKQAYPSLPLQEAVKELTSFIAHTCFTELRATAVIDKLATNQKCIAILDSDWNKYFFESSCTSPEVGLFGTCKDSAEPGYTGLIHLLPSEELIDVALGEARRLNVVTETSANLNKERRMQALGSITK